ncbi:Steadiness box (SB) domain [Trypanosoma melophagium]|uniref:Steadiness box (SB) domain n=1 Tax=Trypanosoma melophagium TaxID=715481 RepID=UPI003519DDCF|nr:Steadiness box (SB) domain [Trypanosoma melophagium]
MEVSRSLSVCMTKPTNVDSRTRDFSKSLKYWSNPSNLVDVYENYITAGAVAGYLMDFLPHCTKYPARINIIQKDGGSAISLCFLIRTFPKGSLTSCLVDVGILIPHGFPVSVPRCRVRPRDLNEKIKNSAFLNGFIVPLQYLTLLNNLEPPYPIIKILEAVNKAIEEDINFFTGEVSLCSNNRDNQKHFEQEGIMTSSTTLRSFDKSPVRFMETTLPALNGKRALSQVDMQKSRTCLLNEAAEAIFKWQLGHTNTYLNLREESFPLFFYLYRKRECMVNETDELRLVKNNLYQMCNLSERLVCKTQSMALNTDSLEFHSMCIVPADDLQARALELLGEIHASDDSLELLERALKAGQLSCEEYVRRVSDVGREQFEARFLFGRVTEAVNRSSSGSGRRLPQSPPRVNATHRRTGEPIKVPKKLENEGVLLREFPEVGTEMIKAVLNLANGSLEEARVQLKAMLS